MQLPSPVSLAPLSELPVARKLCFEMELPEDEEHVEDMPLTFAAMPPPVSAKRGRGCPRKSATPLVAPAPDFSTRRMTRSAAKLNGFKPASVLQVKSRSLRQSCAKQAKLDGATLQVSEQIKIQE